MKRKNSEQRGRDRERRSRPHRAAPCRRSPGRRREAVEAVRQADRPRIGPKIKSAVDDDDGEPDQQDELLMLGAADETIDQTPACSA